MMRIGLMSDTHGHLDPLVFKYFAECDEIWHAGDVGDKGILEDLESFKPLRAVFGNIDDGSVRHNLPEYQRFILEEVDVWMTHIGGYPGLYDRRIRAEIRSNPPDLFVCGHSHILKVMYDKKLKCLCMNPGACGLVGFHRVKTLLRFTLDAGNIKAAEVVELGRR